MQIIKLRKRGAKMAPPLEFQYGTQVAAILIDVKFIDTHRMPLLCKKWKLIIHPLNKWDNLTGKAV